MTSNACALGRDRSGGSVLGNYPVKLPPHGGVNPPVPAGETDAELSLQSHLEPQRRRYDDFYLKRRKWRRIFRFDIRYRCRRLREVLHELGIPVEGARVLDYGFGAGDLLASFPHSCRLQGVDIAASAVRAAVMDPRFDAYADAHFECIAENEPDRLVSGPFDIVISSHVLEHVVDDERVLRELRKRLCPGGHLVIFVPIEEPDYIPFHLRNYSLQSISTEIRSVGFELLHLEGSMQINGHVWKLLTVPSRRRWPLLGPIVDAFRLATLSAIPYRALRIVDACLHYLGFGPRQALVVARRPR